MTFKHFSAEDSARIDAAADELIRTIAELCPCNSISALGQNVVAQALVALCRHGPIKSTDAMCASISGALMAMPEDSKLKSIAAGAEFMTLRALQITLGGSAS